MHRRTSPRLTGVLAATGILCGTHAAFAEEATGRDVDRHPHYFFEAEPHALIGLFEPRPFGVGFRGTFVLSDSGFIRSVNDTVGLGVGIDWTHDAYRLSRLHRRRLVPFVSSRRSAGP